LLESMSSEIDIAASDVRMPDAGIVIAARPEPRRRPLRTLLVLGISATVLPLVIFASWLAWLDYRNLRQTSLNALQTNARALMQAIDAELALRSGILLALSHAKAISEGNFARFHANLTAIVTDQPPGTSVSLVDANGQTLVTSAKPFDTPLLPRTDQAAVASVIASGQPLLGDIESNPATQPTLSIYVPVTIDGKIPYVLDEEVPLDPFQELLRRQKIPPDWIAGVLDHAGILVARVPANNSVGKKGNPIFLAAVSHALEGNIDIVSRESVSVVSSWSRSEQSGWTMTISQPRDSFRQALWENLKLMGAMALLALIVGFGSATVLARQIITPMVNLAGRAATIGRGSVPSRMHTGVLEIARVEEALSEADKRLLQRDAERDAFEGHQKLLLSELDHRVKNTLSAAMVVVRRSVKDPKDGIAAAGRIEALAKAHVLVSEAQWHGASLKQIIGIAVSARSDRHRIVLDGPDLHLKPKSTQALCLLLHELATNAAKYGALSGSSGLLTVSWRVEKKSNQCLQFDWQESEGPPVIPPTNIGFGTRLLELIVKSQLRGEIQLEYLPRARFTIPLAPNEANDPGPTQAIPANIHPAAVQDIAGRRILLVEDEAIVAVDVADLLRHAGCKVIGPAMSLRAAMAFADETPFDAAVLDVNLAGEVVFPLAGILRARGIPFVFLSGYSRSYIWPSEFASVPRFDKPLNAAELLTGLTNLLADTASSQLAAVG
jgi:two-component sensor histidine kinase